MATTAVSTESSRRGVIPTRRDFLKFLGTGLLSAILPSSGELTLSHSSIDISQPDRVDEFWKSGRINSGDLDGVVKSDILGMTVGVGAGQYDLFKFDGKSAANAGQDIMYVKLVSSRSKDWRRLSKVERKNQDGALIGIDWILDLDTNPTTTKDRKAILSYPPEVSAVQFIPPYFISGVEQDYTRGTMISANNIAPTIINALYEQVSRQNKVII